MLPIDKFTRITDQLKESGNYRVFNDILRERGSFPNSIWHSKYNIKKVINWCSNDYLGMGQHKVVLDAMRTALDHVGAGSGGDWRAQDREGEGRGERGRRLGEAG